ncbi:MAG: hypothetical protein GY705_25475 [Bacteroidetes bacterium]|nr:hypothetical protein [Bacteroidota bacterium]
MGKIAIIAMWIFLMVGVEGRFEKKNYLEYHKKFAEIEELIVNEEFEKAESNFERLFDVFEVKFVKDLVIAAQLCALNNNNEKALDLLVLAMRKGVKIKCLKAIQLLNNKLLQEEWQKIEEHSKNSDARKEYLKTLDLNLYQEFHKRYQREQETKRTEYYKKTVYSNFNRIKDLINEGQFPGEEEIGIDNEKYASSLSDCELGNSRIIVTLLHYDYPISEIGQGRFVKAIENGKLHPREYITMYTYERNKVSVLYEKSNKVYPELPEYKFNFPFGKRSDDIDRVNSDRSKFGICKYEVDIKKKEICQKYGMKLSFNYK